MRGVNFQARAGRLALLAILFGATVGLWNALLDGHGDNEAHHHSVADFDPDTCVFCIDGMTPCPVELAMVLGIPFWNRGQIPLLLCYSAPVVEPSWKIESRAPPATS